MPTHNTLWTADAISQAVKGRWLTPPQENFNITGVSYYIGQVEPGDLVFASQDIWGSAYANVNRSLEIMQRKRAHTAIVDQLPSTIPSGLSVYLSDNTDVALNQLGTAARSRFQGTVLCVTGSVGKSTTKRGLAHVLSKQSNTAETLRNFNHSPGVPMSLAQTPADYTYGVYEFAVDAPRYTLSKAMIARPHVAIVTEIQHDHHHFYPTIEAIVDQKSLLFRGLTNEGVAILNRDTPYYGRLETAALSNGASRIITFGEHRLADVRLIDSECYLDTSRITASVLGHTIHYQMGIPGKHNIRNSLAILAAVYAINANYEQAAADLITLSALPNHCIRTIVPFRSGDIELIDDTFSANPASVKAAFEYLKLLQPPIGGRKIVILGDIKELGSSSASLHAGLADPFLHADIDKLYAIGPEIKHLCNALPTERIGIHTEDPQALIEAVQAAIKPGDVVLVKGSCRSSDILNKILDALHSQTHAPQTTRSEQETYQQ